jgi:hypothetical protein
VSTLLSFIDNNLTNISIQASKRNFYSATGKYMDEIEREMGVKVCIFAAFLGDEDDVKTIR